LDSDATAVSVRWTTVTNGSAVTTAGAAGTLFIPLSAVEVATTSTGRPISALKSLLAVSRVTDGPTAPGAIATAPALLQSTFALSQSFGPKVTDARACATSPQ